MSYWLNILTFSVTYVMLSLTLMIAVNAADEGAKPLHYFSMPSVIAANTGGRGFAKTEASKPKGRRAWSLSAQMTGLVILVLFLEAGILQILGFEYSADVQTMMQPAFLFSLLVICGALFTPIEWVSLRLGAPIELRTQAARHRKVQK